MGACKKKERMKRPKEKKRDIFFLSFFLSSSLPFQTSPDYQSTSSSSGHCSFLLFFLPSLFFRQKYFSLIYFSFFPEKSEAVISIYILSLYYYCFYYYCSSQISSAESGILKDFTRFSKVLTNWHGFKFPLPQSV